MRRYRVGHGGGTGCLPQVYATLGGDWRYRGLPPVHRLRGTNVNTRTPQNPKQVAQNSNN